MAKLGKTRKEFIFIEVVRSVFVLLVTLEVRFRSSNTRGADRYADRKPK